MLRSKTRRGVPRLLTITSVMFYLRYLALVASITKCELPGFLGLRVLKRDPRKQATKVDPKHKEVTGIGALFHSITNEIPLIPGCSIRMTLP